MPAIESEVEREMKAKCASVDKNSSGLITVDQLRQVMVELGEDVGDADVREMIAEAKCEAGKDQVDYMKFITALYAEEPEEEEL